jgi:branched-chain amino acid transport system ATP-binding protein
MSNLAIQDASAGYAGTDVLRGVSVSIMSGACVGVLGPNGAGKSTLLKVLSGQLRIRSGSRSLDGRDLRSWSPHHAARDGVRWIGEPRPIYPGLTVIENLEIGGICDRAAVEENMANVFELLPALQEKRTAQAGTLSGGQQQMLAFAQALMSRPRFLCLDEPSLGLSPAMVSIVAELVSTLVSSGVGVAWAEQYPAITRAHSTELVVLSAGRVIASGRPEAVTDEQLEKAYLG